MSQVTISEIFPGTDDELQRIYFYNASDPTKYCYFESSDNAIGSWSPVRAWVRMGISSGSPSIQASGNVSAINDNGVGNYTLVPNYYPQLGTFAMNVLHSGRYYAVSSSIVNGYTFKTYHLNGSVDPGVTTMAIVTHL